jgi:hypothetical protein
VIDHVTGAHPINQFDRPRARLVGFWRPNGPSRQSKVGERGCHLVQAAAPPPVLHRPCSGWVGAVHTRICRRKTTTATTSKTMDRGVADCTIQQLFVQALKTLPSTLESMAL